MNVSVVISIGTAYGDVELQMRNRAWVARSCCNYQLLYLASHALQSRRGVFCIELRQLWLLQHEVQSVWIPRSSITLFRATFRPCVEYLSRSLRV